MKLNKPPYPEVIGTAAYFFTHAGHRETAIDHAIEVIREDAARTMTSTDDDPLMAALEAPIGPWVIESLIQGAWMREYHEWEKATKGYFEGQHQRNGASKPDWKGKVAGVAGAASHVDRVRAQLVQFGASAPTAALDAIDAQRRLINAAKHEDEYFATEGDYRTLVKAVADFWNALASQEEFTVCREAGLGVGYRWVLSESEASLSPNAPFDTAIVAGSSRYVLAELLLQAW